MDGDEVTVKIDEVEEAARQWGLRYPGASGFRGVVSLIRAYSTVARSIEAILKPFDLNLSRYEVLLLLSFTRHGRLPTMRLRDLLLVHGSSVTYLVDRLEAKGLARRAPSPDDGRVSLVCITDAGRAAVERASRALAAAEFGVVGGLDEAERDVLTEVLRPLREARGAASDERGEIPQG